MSGETVGAAYRWRYEASLGLVGIPSLDGRLLLPPQPGQGHQLARGLPLPVLGFPRVSRAGDGQGQQAYTGPEPVAIIARVELRPRAGRSGELIASGVFGDTPLAQSYAGALAVDAVALGMDLRMQAPPVPLYRALGFEDWQVRAAMVVQEPAWDRSLLTAPRVWREFSA